MQTHIELYAQHIIIIQKKSPSLRDADPRHPKTEVAAQSWAEPLFANKKTIKLKGPSEERARRARQTNKPLRLPINRAKNKQ